jgi:hypothetical protein
MLARSLASLLSFYCLALKSTNVSVAPESMHLNSAGTSLVLRLPVTAHLIDFCQLELETQEAELIQAASS